ncbi:casein kinase 2 regulatory subunit [Coemansia sp. RSA 552]|nr:casein kinase 2 regulatory subunit [Coemansia sp. RSA 552]
MADPEPAPELLSALDNTDESDFDEGPYASDDSASLTWISWFCSLKGNEFFCPVPEEFIEDEFNLTGLRQSVNYYVEALDMILDIEDENDDPLDADEIEAIDASAEILYGLIHARYVLTRNGLHQMADKYENGDFGFCPRYYCDSAYVLPCGRTDVPERDSIKLFCPSCLDIYAPPSSRYQKIDGAYFGTTFPHIFFQAFPSLIPDEPSPIYTPQIYGFAISERSKPGPRMHKGPVGRYQVLAGLDRPYARDTGIVKAWMFGGWAYKVSRVEYARKLFAQTDIFQKVEIRKLMPHNLGPRVTGSSFSFENGDAFRGHRAVIGPAFRRSWPTQLFRKPLLELMDAITRESPRPLDVLLWFRRGTLDVLGHIVMSYDFRALSDPDNKQRAMYDSLLEAMLHPIYNMFPWLDLFATGKRAEQWNYLAQFHQFIDGIIDARLEDMEGCPALSEDERNHADLLTLLLEAYNLSRSGKAVDDCGKQVAPMSREQLRSNIALFYVAGYDTMASSLAYVMMELARFPDIQTKARNIVISVLGDRKDAYPTDEQLKELGYIDLIVKETLRRNSILAEIRRRLAKPVQLGPYTLPKGAVVSVDTWAMHYNPEYFPDPQRFAPERFSEDRTSELRSNVPFTYAPFSNGSRQCVGMRFSLIEQRVAIALLLLRFEWTLPSDSPFWHSTPAAPAGLISPVGLMVDIRPRNQAH